MDSLELARRVVRECLQLGAVADGFDRDTRLLGAFPEFNSLTITSVVVMIEDALDCEIPDTEIEGEAFETLGTLADFIDRMEAQA